MDMNSLRKPRNNSSVFSHSTANKLSLLPALGAVKPPFSMKHVVQRAIKVLLEGHKTGQRLQPFEVGRPVDQPVASFFATL
jgi:hypothetical protein